MLELLSQINLNYFSDSHTYSSVFYLQSFFIFLSSFLSFYLLLLVVNLFITCNRLDRQSATVCMQCTLNFSHYISSYHHAFITNVNYVGPVTTYCVAIHLTFDLLNYKLAHWLLLHWEILTQILVFLCLIVFQSANVLEYGDRLTDGYDP